MNTKYNAIMCRYHEIAIKGNNRGMFEKVMMENLRYLLKEINGIEVFKVRGRIWCSLKDKVPFSEDDVTIIKIEMQKAFGLESYSLVIMTDSTFESIIEAIKESEEDIFETQFSNKKKVNYRVRARRGDKKFPLRSREIEVEVASYIGKKYDGKPLTVNLEDNADITIGIEVREKWSFVFYEQFPCPGGLPVGSNSQVLALLSGGIDSPVACYMMMKRGCNVEFLTFHSRPYTPPETENKIYGIGRYLNTFQKPKRIFSCNLAPLQKAFRDNCRDRFRTILYRRAMLRIANLIAKKQRHYALVTGDSVGQVASQTVVNMNTINAASELVVLRPLVGMDKNEAINIARKIGTFDLSNEQVPDSCSVFQPSNVSTRAFIEELEAEEDKVENLTELLQEAVDTIEILY
ncbi:tRNA uracil 4-sulfurtransferase ThiI [Lentisphaerota bacterium WC36G]|nr:tRNA 4-thiouridine(8) synthase ThiI [Lentisphaerae bacterium WC36]